MKAFRIADRRHPVFDPTGAFLKGGRWNSPGRRVIYAAETYAGALLEMLVHANLRMLPRTQVCVEITIAETVAVEWVEAKAVPGWDAEDMVASRAFGDQWLEKRRTAVLLAPSVVTRGRERNVLLNPEHAEFGKIAAGAPEPVLWDRRLFKG